MREIKFRAWHKATKTMSYNPLTITGYLKTQHQHIDDDHINHFFDEYAQVWQVLMQYTGLKDKNGGIYEGDIIENDDGRYVVTYLKFGFG